MAPAATQSTKLRLILLHGIAVLASVLAVLAGRLVDACEAQIALLQAAVAVAVWYGGLAPALLAAALGSVAITLLAGPAGPSAQPTGLLGYLLSCSIIIALGHHARVARGQAFAELIALRRLDQALRACKLEFCTVFELAAVGAAQLDPITGRFLRVNRRLCEITGYSEAELLARTFTEITHPDDRERDLPVLDTQSRSAAQDAWQIEKRYVRKDGGIAWVLVTGRMIRDSRGRLVRSAAHILDVTERKQAEQALRRSEARYRALVEAIANVIWTWNPDTGEGDHEEALRWWQEMTGQSPEAQRGSGWLDVVHPDDREQVSAAWIGTLRAGTPFYAEYRVHTRTGECRHMLSRAAPVHEPGSAEREWVGMLADVTEQHRAQEALRHSEELLRLIIDTVPAVIAYVGPDFVYRLANRSHERWLGVPVEQIIGRHARDVLGASAWQEVLPYAQRALAGEEVTCEQELEYPTGRRWVHCAYTPDVDPQGQVRGLAVLVNDITERKQAEEALKEADRRKDEFLATLAHELRNPLAPIRSSLQLLKLPAADATIHERARAMMERQLEHLVRLVDDLLDVSRIMRGKIELRMQVVSLDVVVARALETVQPLVDLRHHALEVSLPDPPVAVYADPIRLAQVVGNLLTNAAKYTEPGGHIWLEVERSGSDALIRVRDDGIGIAPDVLPRIFEPFVQADHSTSRTQGGLGIGLTLVKRLVEMHRGRITVYSAGPGQGTELAVRLPAVPAPEPRPGPDPAGPPRGELKGNHMDENAPGPEPAHGRILVVDDNTDAGETLAMLLGLYGYDTQVVGSGLAALERIPSFRPDVIFLDIGMPVMDGYEVARRLRAMPEGKHAYLVALTGWGQAEDRRRTSEAGFDHHLIKPVEPGAVRALLGRVLAPPH